MASERKRDEEFYRRMFKCDAARFVRTPDRTFLLIGTNRSTKDDAAKWFKNGEPFDFDYVAEEVIASGVNAAELYESAKEYKRLLGMDMLEYLESRLFT